MSTDTHGYEKEAPNYLVILSIIIHIHSFIQKNHKNYPQGLVEDLVKLNIYL